MSLELNESCNEHESDSKCLQRNLVGAASHLVGIFAWRVHNMDKTQVVKPDWKMRAGGLCGNHYIWTTQQSNENFGSALKITYRR